MADLKDVFTVTIVDRKRDELNIGRSFYLNVRARDVTDAAQKALKIFQAQRAVKGSAEELIKRPYVSGVTRELTLDD